MKSDELIKEVKKLLCDKPTNSNVRICVLQRGWVYVGRFSQDGPNCVLTDASTIRVWGTTKGLGEIVGGPTAKTVLDRVGTVRFHELTAVNMIDCCAEGWEKSL